MMQIDVLTLFPEMFAPVRLSMLKKAQEKGLLKIRLIDIRDYSRDKHHKTDDTPFGGGNGMVMMADPISGAMEAVHAEKKRVLYMSPRGRILDRELIIELSKEEELVILCGHYEGVDQRALDLWHCEEVSIGDYVLTGGELPAMVLIDSVARLIPGVLANMDAAVEESVYSGLLEYPQYTQPRKFRDRDVPEVLLGGNHKSIALWRFEQALRLTKKLRPDLYDEFLKNHGDLTKEQQKVMEKTRELL